MNEFTKEELIDLEKIVNGHCVKNINDNEASTLRYKISDLIDEYGEKKFTAGDKVWLFHTEYGKNCWGDDDTFIYPNEINLIWGEIFSINSHLDEVQIKVPHYDMPIRMGLTFLHESAYGSRNEAIEGMLIKMNQFKNYDDGEQVNE